MQSAVDPACIFLITAGSLCAISSNPQVSVIGNQGNQPIPKAINPGKLPSDTDVLSGIRYLCTALIISYPRTDMGLSVLRYLKKDCPILSEDIP